MAHEINNPLQAVGSRNLSRQVNARGTRSLGRAAECCRSRVKARRAYCPAGVGFCRESPAAELIDIPATGESVLALYTSRFQSKDIRVECNYGDCPPVEAVLGEIKQVFLLRTCLPMLPTPLVNKVPSGCTLGAAEEAANDASDSG